MKGQQKSTTFPRIILLDVTLLTRSSKKNQGTGPCCFPKAHLAILHFTRVLVQVQGSFASWCQRSSVLGYSDGDLSKKVGKRDENTYIPKMDGQTDVSAVDCVTKFWIYYITLYTILHYITLYYTILHYITLYYTILHYITLYTILHYIVLFTILHYIMLYYNVI